MLGAFDFGPVFCLVGLPNSRVHVPTHPLRPYFCHACSFKWRQKHGPRALRNSQWTRNGSSMVRGMGWPRGHSAREGENQKDCNRPEEENLFCEQIPAILATAYLAAAGLGSLLFQQQQILQSIDIRNHHGDVGVSKRTDFRLRLRIPSARSRTSCSSVLALYFVVNPKW